MVEAINNKLLKLCDRLPNWEARYPTEDSRYDAMIKLMYISMAVAVLGRVEYAVMVHTESLFLILVCGLLGLAITGVNLYFFAVSIYVLVKSNVFKFLLRLVGNIILGCIAMSIITTLLGPVGAAISVVVAIVANRKRLAVLKKYKSAVMACLGAIFVPIGLGAVGILMLTGAEETHSRFLAFLSVVVVIAAFVSPLLIVKNWLRSQQRKGVPFFDAVRIFNTIPFVMACCFLSYLTLTHIGGLSGDSVFGDPGTDFLDGGAISGVDGVGHAEAAGLDSVMGHDASGLNSATGMDSYDTSTTGVHGINDAGINGHITDATGHVTSNHNDVSHGHLGTTDASVSDTSTYQVSDANMQVQGSVTVDSDGNGVIQDNAGVTHATISHDALNNTVVKDFAGQTVASVDGAGFVHDASGDVTAQITRANGVETVTDLKTGEVTLNNNGFVTDKNGVVGNIHKVK